MRIIYLFDRTDYIEKMSRVRFHLAFAIAKECDFKFWGLNWEGYDSKETVSANLERIGENPEYLIIYKPLNYLGLKDVKAKKILIYNEMYEFDLTRKEINDSQANIVICHHENDYKFWKSFYEFLNEKDNEKMVDILSKNLKDNYLKISKFL